MITLRTLLALLAASMAQDEAQAANAATRVQPTKPVIETPLVDPLEQTPEIA